MNYIGSKFKLSQWIKGEIHNVVGKDLSSYVFCDLFAGTGIIGRSFKGDVKKVIANDIEAYSYVLNQNYIGNNKALGNAIYLLAELNEIPQIEGFIYKNYCMGSGSQRQYFSNTNGKKIDAIRMQIESWKNEKYISLEEYYFLLASLIESADKVANTASVYGAFLKKLKKSAEKDLKLEGAMFSVDRNEHDIYNEDANSLIRKISGDILYLDPPYNARQYGSNYHLLNTIALYDDFIPKGKTGLREYHKSKYCSKSVVSPTFEDLIKHAQFKYIFLSYNNEGLMPVEYIRKVFERYGKYEQLQTTYQRFKADKSENRQHKADSTLEYLHILEKIK